MGKFIVYGENKMEVENSGEEFKAFIDEKMTMEDYHAQGNIAEKPDTFSLSKSMLAELNDCPARFKHLYIDGGQQIEADHLSMGTAVHTLALEPEAFNDRFYVIGEGIKRDKRTELFKAEINKAAGRSMITAKDFDKVAGMSKVLAADPIARGLLDGPGYIESSIFYKCPKTGLRKRVRPDWFRRDGKLVVNLKTSHSARPDLFYKTAYDFAYDMGAAMELEAMDAIFGPDPERNYVLLVIEPEAPHVISAFDTKRPMTTGDDEDNRPVSYVDVGQTRLEKALAKFQDCLQTGFWPGYIETIEPMRVPAWMMKRVLEKGE